MAQDSLDVTVIREVEPFSLDYSLICCLGCLQEKQACIVAYYRLELWRIRQMQVDKTELETLNVYRYCLRLKDQMFIF